MADPSDPGFDPRAIFEDAQKRFLESEDNLRKGLDEEGGIFARLMNLVTGFFSAQWASVWTRASNVFKFILVPLWSFVSGAVFATGQSEIDHLLGWMRAQDMLDDNDVQQLESFLTRTKVLGPWLAGPITGMVMMRVFGAFLDVLGGTAIQNLNKKYSPTVPDPNSLVRTSFIAPELHDKVVELCKRAGYSEEDIKLLFVSQYALQNPVDIMQLVWRGELTEDQAINRMQELGFTSDRVAELMKLWERIPTLQDVVRYQGKEAFEPAMINTFGLMEDFPKESIKWAAKQGLSERWAQAEWVSHWRDIGINFMLQAYHRDIVDWPFVEKYMRLIEFPPGIREVVKETAYNVITRVDARRMHKVGLVGTEQLFDLYRFQGFSPESARLMTEFTIMYNGGDERDLTKTDILKGYEDGDLLQQEALGLLVDLGYEKSVAEYYVIRVDQEKQTSLRMDYLEDIKYKYTNNMLSRADAERQMLSIGFDLSRVTVLLAKYDALRNQNNKLPSKTDLDKQLRREIINEAEYRAEMGRLGYNETYINRYVKMIEEGE